MRLVFITLAVAVAAIVGFLFFRGASAPAPSTEAATNAASTPTALHTNCETQYAVYQYNEDQRVRLFFRRVPASPSAGPELSNGMGGHQIGNMMFVVSLASINKEYVFTPVNRMASGPAYESYVLYVRPQSGGGAQMPVQLFNSEMHIISDMPRDDSEAPRYIIMPDLMRRLYADRIDMPTGAFRFFRCEPPQPPRTAP
jgi:hypothetical protein